MALTRDVGAEQTKALEMHDRRCIPGHAQWRWPTTPRRVTDMARFEYRGGWSTWMKDRFRSNQTHLRDARPAGAGGMIRRVDVAPSRASPPVGVIARSRATRVVPRGVRSGVSRARPLATTYATGHPTQSQNTQIPVAYYVSELVTCNL
eukprot:845793-Prymnesium_polylepis.1